MEVADSYKVKPVCYFVFHLRDVERTFSILHFPYPFSWFHCPHRQRGAQGWGLGGWCLPGWCDGVGGYMEMEGEAGQDLRAQLGMREDT